MGLVLITVGGYKIETFGGLFGIEELPDALSLLFSLFVYIVVVNALNLIDGVDGLVGGYTMIAMSAFAFWFLKYRADRRCRPCIDYGGSHGWLFGVQFCACAHLPRRQRIPLVGLVAYALATHTINTPQELVPDAWMGISKPVIAMSILAYPLMDTLRVFCLRAARGISPFSPD